MCSEPATAELATPILPHELVRPRQISLRLVVSATKYGGAFQSWA